MFQDQENIASLASKFINSTNCHVFLTGKAGTGKTTFLKEVVETSHKNLVVAAPTGVAAINAGGVTLHSLFQLPFGSFVPVSNPPGEYEITFELNTPKSLLRELQMNSHRRKMLQELELLIIDEVSMLRADLLDAIDTVLRHIRRQKNLSFGGIQVLFIGDLLQLPPVIREDEGRFLSGYYPSLYFFEAKALQNQKLLHIELGKIYRQTDEKFISILNRIRENKLSGNDIVQLNQHYKPLFRPGPNEDYIYLTTHNRRADEMNSHALKMLGGSLYGFDAMVEGDFPENIFPVEFSLKLKQGAQVMFIKNDYSGEQLYFNGKIGFVSEISDDEIIVSFRDGSPDAIVEHYTWENKRFFLNNETGEIEEKIIGRFIHYPIKLAWAITIHKSQGLTFKKAIIDVAGAFAPGQVYVALSRLESLEGLVLSSPVQATGLDPDKVLVKFADTKENPESLEEKLKSESFRYITDNVTKSYNFSGIIYSLKYHIDSYDKEENRSEKQKHKKWAEDLLNDFQPVMEIAQKFIMHAKAILESGKNDNLTLLHQRIVAANGYFQPLLKNFSKRATDKVNLLKSQKGIKAYLNELRDIDFLFFRHLKQLIKTELLIRMSLKNEELTKAEILKIPVDADRAGPKAKKDKTEKQKEKKKEKPDTKKISFQLFIEGKTIREIARERNLSATTIEGHLAYYVAIGELEASLFVGPDAIDKIVEVSKKLETLHLGPIREILGEEFSYSQIRFALADYICRQSRIIELPE